MCALQALVSFFHKSPISPMGTVPSAEIVKVGQIKMPKGVGRKKAKGSMNQENLVSYQSKGLRENKRGGDHRDERQSSEVLRINGRALTLHQTTPIKLWVITSLIKVPHLETWTAFVPISQTLFPFDALKGSNGLMAFSEEAILEQELTLSCVLLLEVPEIKDKQWVPPADHN